MPRGDSAGGEGSTVKLETPPSLKEWALALKGAQDVSTNTRNSSCWGWGECPERNGRAFHELKAQAVSHSPHFIDPNPQPRVAQPSNEGEFLQISSICLSRRTCSLFVGGGQISEFTEQASAKLEIGVRLSRARQSSLLGLGACRGAAFRC